MSEDIESLRQRIDAVDIAIIERLNERLNLVAKVGSIKERDERTVYAPGREEAIFQKLAILNKGPLSETAIRSIYREIISTSLALQKATLVAYLGPEVTYTHQAALKNFGSSIHYQPFTSINDVFTAVEKKEADYGVVPIENSTEGAVFHSFDKFAESDLKITAQVFLKIEHALLSESPIDKIETVLSKDQALGQCRGWLQRNLPHAQLKSVSSTAEAVQQATGSPGTAAIASKLAGEFYNLPLIKGNIQDSVDNVTRFLVISPTASSPPSKKGEDRTSLLISINDEVGALQKALTLFSVRGLNLTKIESRPSRRKIWDYHFFIDFIGHYQDGKVQSLIADLERLCHSVKWLGSYPNATE